MEQAQEAKRAPGPNGSVMRLLSVIFCDGGEHVEQYGYVQTMADAVRKIGELRDSEARLLAALQGLLDALPSATTHPAVAKARAAIARATGSAA